MSEAFVQAIADNTSGACELGSPRENMSERIVRHFKRIDQPEARSVQIEWPHSPASQLPAKVSRVYSGDTLPVFGWFTEPPIGEVSLTMRLQDGQVINQSLTFAQEVFDADTPAGNLPRLAADALMNTLDDDDATKLAVQYQLVTEYTSCVLVYKRGEESNAADIPALRRVPQVLAAGWGGMGSFQLCEPGLCMEENVLHSIMPVPVSKDLSEDLSYLDIPAFCRRASSSPMHELVKGLNQHYSNGSRSSLSIASVSDLAELGLDRSVADSLTKLVADGNDELHIVICFLAQLLEKNSGEKINRHMKRIIRKARNKISVSSAVVKSIDLILEDCE